MTNDHFTLQLKYTRKEKIRAVATHPTILNGYFLDGMKKTRGFILFECRRSRNANKKLSRSVYANAVSKTGSQEKRARLKRCASLNAQCNEKRTCERRQRTHHHIRVRRSVRRAQ